MAREMIFGLIGGLGLFLFGMGMLSQGLKRAAGDRMRRILATVTKHRVIALFVGAGVTCLIQSSSATTVMVVGLINAGLLTLRQAISVILGANIGTTCTAWLVGFAAGIEAFKITEYALLSTGLGFLLTVLPIRGGWKHLGQILLGFGILFLGIRFMKEAFEPLQGDEGVKGVLIWIGDKPILAVLAGAAITMLLQSSSASIAMIQVLAVGAAFGSDWETALRIAIPFVMGDNIGTTITAQIAALRANVAGRRAAMAHTVFNVLGVVVVLPLLYIGWFNRMVLAITPGALTGSTIAIHIAVAHTSFNVVSSIVMLPLVSVLERLVIKIVPARKGDVEIKPVVLERHLLATPPLAVDQAQREIVRMASTARDALRSSIDGIRNDDRRAIAQTLEAEDAVDNFQTQITRYLVELSQRPLSPQMANELPVLLHSVNDLERVADHAVNITEIAERKIDQKETFSPAATAEIQRMTSELELMFEDVLAAVDKGDLLAAERALVSEGKINQMQMDFRQSHVLRLTEQDCSPIAGLLFVDFVDNMEKIGDHLTNVAQGVIGGLQWIGEGDHRPPPTVPNGMTRR